MSLPESFTAIYTMGGEAVKHLLILVIAVIHDAVTVSSEFIIRRLTLLEQWICEHGKGGHEFEECICMEHEFYANHEKCSSCDKVRVKP